MRRGAPPPRRYDDRNRNELLFREPCHHTKDEGSPQGKMTGRGGIVLDQGVANCTRILDEIQ